MTVSLTLREVKGGALTWAELDGNYLKLNYTVLDLDATSSESSFENVLAAKSPDFVTSIRPSITVSRGGNAALASLLSYLVILGLITDGSTP
jgi:hypothetical protein